MDPVTAAALGSAGASILGGVLGADAQARAVDDTNKAQKEMARDNMIMQKEFAQNGIRWRVEDAKAAGLSPLAALGASGSSYSPVSIGTETNYSQADMYKNMGQDVSRAIQATRTEQERKLAELQLQSLEADVQGKALDNQLRASQLHKMNQVGPSLPSPMDRSGGVPGQGNAKGYNVKAADITASALGDPSREAGAINDWGYVRTPKGLAIVPSSDSKQRIEDQTMPEFLWALRNTYIFEKPPYPSDVPVRDGNAWHWNPFAQEWEEHSKYGGRGTMEAYRRAIQKYKK